MRIGFSWHCSKAWMWCQGASADPLNSSHSKLTDILNLLTFNTEKGRNSFILANLIFSACLNPGNENHDQKFVPFSKHCHAGVYKKDLHHDSSQLLEEWNESAREENELVPAQKFSIVRQSIFGGGMGCLFVFQLYQTPNLAAAWQHAAEDYFVSVS